MKKLGKDFYLRDDVVTIARELLGKVLVTEMAEGLTSGIITETEAYRGITDRASHAWNNRRTARTEIMFGPAGHAYVYLCYGIHSLFNVVTNVEGVPHAVLIRAVYPLKGIELMERRRRKSSGSKNFSIGPGSVSAAMGIHYSNTGESLLKRTIRIEDHGIHIPPALIRTGPRIGVEYAGEDAALPYRFLIEHRELEKLLWLR